MANVLAWEDDRAAGDRHVLAGTDSFFNLQDQLRFTVVTASASTSSVALYLPANPGAAFDCKFVSLRSDKGITLDPKTGIVTASATPHAEVHNFIVAAVLKEPGGAEHTVHIRFHVHKSVAKAWLTPSPLTVFKKFADHHYRFSVYAQFDDGVIGDLSYYASQINWQPNAIIGTVGQISINPSDPDGTSIDITAT
ncbi:MAG: hypothetical protein ACREXR_03735, partial [Gammaproteobacteria bacterium]